MNTTAAVQLLLPPFCLCLLMVGMLSYLGIHVIKREIIFVDLALAQIAALGALVAFLLGIPLHTQASYWFSIALTAIAAAVFTLTRSRRSRVPQEAVIGLVYAIAAATAIILIDKAPHGAEHIKDILTGSILWVRWRTVALVAAVYASVGFFHLVFRRPFLLLSTDAEAARAQGFRVGLWDFLFYLTFGFVITVSVGSAGVLLVFVFLVAPAVMAVLVTDRLLYQLLIGWALGILATVSGLVVSYVADLSSGPLVIGSYAVVLLLVSAGVHVARAQDRGAAVKRLTVVTAAFALCSAGLFGIGRAVGAKYAAGSVDTHEAPAEADHLSYIDPEAGQLAPDADLTTILAGADSARLRDLFVEHTDPEPRSEIIACAFEVDPKLGADLALQFLAGDPPLFFAQTVIDQLDARLPQSSGLDPSQPFVSPVNRKAAVVVRGRLGI
jgi:zinc/manganese transport system permease protein